MATNYFIKFETPDIQGESADSTHANEIHVLSWSHGFSQPTSPTRSSAGGGTVEQANHADFTFTKYIDSATDDLLKYCWNGQSIGKATFTAYRADGDNKPVQYLQVVMEEVIVANYSLSGGGSDIAVETVSLNYGKVTYNYIAQSKADGTAGGNQPVYHDLIQQEVG